MLIMAMIATAVASGVLVWSGLGWGWDKVTIFFLSTNVTLFLLNLLLFLGEI